nr:F-box/LRR-repeat protein 17-like [Crassostrea gigas]
MEGGKQLTMEEGKQLTMEEGKQLTMEEGKQLTMEEGKQLTMEEESHPCRRRRMDQEENNSPKLHAAVNHINDLPPTILVYILRQLRMCDLLHRASLVCKLWHQLVYDPDLWRRIDLKYQHKVTDTQLLTLTQISDRVTHIDISDTLNLTSEAVEHALKCCTYLRSLHMSRSVFVLKIVSQS